MLHLGSKLELYPRHWQTRDESKHGRAEDINKRQRGEKALPIPPEKSLLQSWCSLGSGMQIHAPFALSHSPVTSLITVWILLSLKTAGHLGNREYCQLDSIQAQLRLPDGAETIHPCWNSLPITAEGMRPAQENELLTDWLAWPPIQIIYERWRKTNGTLAGSFYILLGALLLLPRGLQAVYFTTCRSKEKKRPI